MTARPLPMVLLSVFSTFRIGGAQVRFAAIANHFGRQYRHLIVSMDGALDARTLLSADLDVSFLPIVNRKGGMVANLRTFRRVLRDSKPDLLVTYNWGAIEWAMANWPKVVPHVHIEDGFGPEEAHGQLPRRVWTRQLVLRNSTVVVPSHVLERLALDVWKLSPRRVHYLPNGIDVTRFSGATRNLPVGQSDVPVIGTVAVLRREKNIDRLLEAFRMLRNRRPCKLVIAGDGAERIKLEARSLEMGIAGDVTFIGYRADTERVYASLDAFVISSDTEQMPTSVLEAMAAGLPIVSTDVGDVGNMISSENSRFVVPLDARALAEAGAILFANSNLSREIGNANQVLVARNFSQVKMFSAYETLFEYAVRRRAGSV